MKTRIKIIELKNGTKKYVPQAKTDKVLEAFLLNFITIPFFFIVNSLYVDLGKDGRVIFLGTDECSTEQEAEQAVDLYLKNQKEMLGKKMKKVTYTKYP